MNRPIRRALTAVAAIGSLAFTGLTAFACAAKPTVPKMRVITIPAPDQVSDVYRSDQCPWLRLFVGTTGAAPEKGSAAVGHTLQDSEAPAYNMLISSPLCADEHSKVGN